MGWRKFLIILAGLAVVPVFWGLVQATTVKDCNPGYKWVTNRTGVGACIPVTGTAVLNLSTGAIQCSGTGCNSESQTVGQVGGGGVVASPTPVPPAIGAESWSLQTNYVSTTSVTTSTIASTTTTSSTVASSTVASSTTTTSIYTIPCNWGNEGKWISLGGDGGNAWCSGFYFDCYGGVVRGIKSSFGCGTGANVSTNYTQPAVGIPGCSWSGTRWISQGWDGAGAWQTGIQLTCDGSKVTNMKWEQQSLYQPATAIQTTGGISCNWTGAYQATHGWDGWCAFDTGIAITCSGNKVVNMKWNESLSCPRTRN